MNLQTRGEDDSTTDREVAKGVTKEDIRHAYRILLDREPENDAVLSGAFADHFELRTAFLTSEEFKRKNQLLSPQLDCWVIKESALGFRIFVSLSDLMVCRFILLDAYEEREVETVKSLVAPGETVIDIGANIGFYTLLLGRLVGPAGRVLAFEAMPALAAVAVRSVHENGFEDRCTVHNVALSDRAGMARFRHAPKTMNFGGGHLAPQDPTPADHVDVQVRLARLDDYMPTTRCSFIKIDVEGAEPKVFLGAGDLLRRDQPKILSELHCGQLKLVSGTTATDLIKMMAGHGYRCAHLETGNEVTSYEGERPINVLFLPRGV